MKILVTGGGGFLGWHTRVRLRATTAHNVFFATKENWQHLRELVRDVDAVIHIAGVNRASPQSIEQGNISLARELAAAVVDSGARPRIIYANSIHAGGGDAYGIGKAAAGDILARTAQALDAPFIDVRLPNLFGEHGRPRYNSFVATFVDSLIRGEQSQIQDRWLALLHVQDAAERLLDALSGDQSSLVLPQGTEVSVYETYQTLKAFHQIYATGDIPPLLSKLDVDLFNTLRAALFPDAYPIFPETHTDERGRLVEAVRARGGPGQTFVSNTASGVTRGDHFHLNKVERFMVVSGVAQISLRRALTKEIVKFAVSGEKPAIVDMPTMWVHNIRNVGDKELVTLFWTNSLFDADAPDTFYERVYDAAD